MLFVSNVVVYITYKDSSSVDSGIFYCEHTYILMRYSRLPLRETISLLPSLLTSSIHACECYNEMLTYFQINHLKTYFYQVQIATFDAFSQILSSSGVETTKTYSSLLALTFPLKYQHLVSAIFLLLYIDLASPQVLLCAKVYRINCFNINIF